ncbi:hypothetical protein BKA58DRAFT_417013 [Alternaria rosae]|uniref:uncharacterized protein n=1 Tax=Alternaria rosae TaxID=1187941 RepID=UPI001E8E618B|nr:uncharacterized protein BKA58DRAFT_417013 [Alternaria rosae]KAH6883201.1 hypothetical protein BKA58DRAFT_417013 [Alternaria rosae]
MKSTTQFSAVRQDVDDDARRSADLLTVADNHSDAKSDAPHAWPEKDRRTTFYEKWSPFPWRVTVILLALPLALACIVGLAAAAETVSQGYIKGRDCYPNGLWKEATGATWRIMDSSYFFTPNLSFGALTFTQVKVIDVAWDLIIGRGGQLLLAWANYRVFNEWLVYHMEMHHTSYKLYAALAFETTTMATFGVLGKEFLAYGAGTWKRFFRWLAILSMLLSTLYVIAFPTLMAAMTGYITTYKPYIEDIDGNLMEWSKAKDVAYIIEDADRVGLKAPLVVTADDQPLIDAVHHYRSQFGNWNVTGFMTQGSDTKVLLAEAIPTRGFNMTNGNPNLNITADFVFDGVTTPTSYSLAIATFPIESLGLDSGKKLNDFLPLQYAFEKRPDVNHSYTGYYLLDHGSCKPSETYQWGFSYIFLFMVSIFNFIWVCIMVGMWLDTRRGSMMYRSGRRPGLLRSIMDYSAAIREELGNEADCLEEDELRKRLTQSRGALVVEKRELRVTRTSTGEMTKRGWKRGLTSGSTF